MAKFSKKVKGKEVGQASTYAEPHTMKGAKLDSDLPYTAGAKVMDDIEHLCSWSEQGQLQRS
jgi:hypothetical protein